MHIRQFEPNRDRKALEACVIGLQDYIRDLYPRLPSGAAIVDQYIPHILNQCSIHNGKIYLAEVDGAVVGYALVYSKMICNDIDSGTYEYGRLADLYVKATCRGQGIGKKLLETSEAFVKSAGVQRFKVGVLASNEPAVNLYTLSGFQPFLLDMEKMIQGE